MYYKVIVPYSRNRIAYAIIRSLHNRPGTQVFAADSTKLAMCRFSNKVSGFFNYPSDPNDFLTWAEQKQKEGYTIFPTFMESWQLRQAELIDSTPSYDTILNADNKLNVYKACRMLHLPTPETHIIDFNGVIKPSHGRGSERRFWVRPGDVIQKRVYGDAIGIGMLFNHGELKAKFSWRRLQEFPEDGGTSVIRESTKMPHEEAYAQKLLEFFNWHGVAMVEFKGGHIIEVNPRFWGSLQLAIDSGVDFPRLLLDIITYGDCETVLEWKTGVTTSWLAGCIRRRCRPSGNTEDWHLNDPLPFFGQFALALSNVMRGKGLVLDTT